MSAHLTDKQFATAAVALRRAIKEAGGVTKLSSALGIAGSSVSAWTVCPSAHIAKVSELGGVKKSALRPDLYEA